MNESDIDLHYVALWGKWYRSTLCCALRTSHKVINKLTDFAVYRILLEASINKENIACALNSRLIGQMSN